MKMQDQKKKRQICARRRYEVEVGVRSIEGNGANLKRNSLYSHLHVATRDAKRIGRPCEDGVVLSDNEKSSKTLGLIYLNELWA